MSESQPVSEFKIRFTGGTASLRSVSIRHLSEALKSVQRLLSDSDDAEGVSLHLIGVRNQSAAYRIVTPGHQLFLEDRLRQFGKIIDGAQEISEWIDPLEPLRILSRLARRYGCSIEIRGSGRDNVLAKIEGDTFTRLHENSIVTGDTAIYARIERLGGKDESHCAVRVPAQPTRQLWCRVGSRELVTELAHYLFQGVLLHGKAEWYRQSGYIRQFHVSSFEPPKRGSIAEALREAHEAGGYGWDSVEDVAGKIAEIRDE